MSTDETKMISEALRALAEALRLLSEGQTEILEALDRLEANAPHPRRE